MEVKLTTKGQLVIPKRVRQALGLSEGDRLEVQVVGDKIVLQPLGGKKILAELYGKYAGLDLLAGLEEEHLNELKNE
jgi:AbrB family looped-hinge helix DNA binding protein